MSDELKLEVQALRTLIVVLFKQMKEVTARAEALRCLLVWKQTFSQAEFDEMCEKALAEWDRAMGAAVNEASQVANDAAIQRLLEKYEGTKQ